MNTVNLVQASAEIIQITKLRKGDVYKRLDESAYSDSKLKYGVVYDVMFNGSDAVIQAIEYTKSYDSISTKLEVFATDKDLKLFNCTPEELHEHLGDMVGAAERKLEKAQKELAEAEENLARTKSIVSGELARTLTAPEIQTAPALSE